MSGKIPRPFINRNIGVRNFWGGMDRRSFRWHYGLLTINLVLLVVGSLLTAVTTEFVVLPLLALLCFGRRFYLVNREYSISLYLFWVHVKLIAWMLLAVIVRGLKIDPVHVMPVYYITIDEVKYVDGIRKVISQKMLRLTPPELMYMTYKTSVEHNAELSV